MACTFFGHRDAGYELRDGIYPTEMYSTHFKQAIPLRNKWMLDNSDTVITYVTKSFGGAARFKTYATVKKKRIIELNKNMS